MHDLWLGSTEGAPATLNERLALPALNIHGLASARGIIPSTASASIDVRLVKGMDYRQTFRQLTDHVREQGFHVVDKKPDADILRTHPRVAMVMLTTGGNAMRTPMDRRQQQSQLRRESPAAEPVGRHRAGGGAAADGCEVLRVGSSLSVLFGISSSRPAR